MDHVNRVQGSHAPATQLRIHRLNEGEECTIRTLSPPSGKPNQEILGFLTHWWKRNSRPCRGEGKCDPAMHKVPPIWYGYLLCQIWSDDANQWTGFILQVSEQLELDMRGVYDRGQFWRISRPLEKKSGNPYRGKLLGLCNAAELPEGFDFLSALRSTLHMADLWKPVTPNPLAPRLTMGTDPSSPPPGSKAFERDQARAVPKPTAEEIAHRKEMVDRLRRGEPLPNGKH